MRYRVMNTTRNTLLGTDVRVANTFGARFKGLMGVTSLPMGEGLHLLPCTSVHTFFMKISIDVLFLDEALTVVDLHHALAPWKMSRLYLNACSALELPAGVAAGSKTEPGDRLAFDLLPES
jgi:uncharacterized membrane protein (UPF0127 family)